MTLDIVDGSWFRAHLDRRRWEWIDDQHLVCRERELGPDGDRVITRELIVHNTTGIVDDRLYAERLYSGIASVRCLVRPASTASSFIPI